MDRSYQNLDHYSVRPPKVEAAEIQILSSPQVAKVRARLIGHWLAPIVELALGTGMRRGELCGLTWIAVDPAKGIINVHYSLEETTAGLRVKSRRQRAAGAR